MLRLFSTIFLTIYLFAQAASAQQQDVVWVQVEARPSLAEAQERIRDYAAELPDVNGFALTSGWYAIALGPYLRSDAEEVLRVYRAERAIPRDSYIAFSSSFRQQFWPLGANLLDLPPATPSVPDTPVAEQPEPEQPAQSPDDLTTQPEPNLPDETPQQARASEAALSREEREQLQIALQWAGHYNAAIDGAFGRGTRNSMASWQEANNFQATGILTTAQRATLLGQYNAILEGLDLQLVQDSKTGIEIKLPLGVVKFDRYEPPFAHYAASGDIDARVLLISQKGDQDTLFGLYDIMQTLEIVPLDGPRERNSNSFVLVGEAATFISYTEARLEDGMIKGFTLIWPAADEERRTRLLSEMRASFRPIEGVLDTAAGSDTEQRIDLLSGLEIRQPKHSTSGFYTDSTGTVVTTLSGVEQCQRITIDGNYEASVIASDAATDLAALRPQEPLAPAATATFQSATPRLQSEVAVAGFSYGGVLDAATLTFGKLADLRGLKGEEGLQRLALNTLPGDIGGPVIDAGGAVLGMLLPDPENGKTLPEDVSFSAGSNVIRAFLEQSGLTPQTSASFASMAPEDLAARAAQMTVLVNCWD